MELKLTVRKNGAVEKTYAANTYELMFGQVEDILECIDVDAIAGAKSDAEMVAAVGKAAVGAMGALKPVLCDAFGITEEELRRVPLREVVAAVAGIASFAMAEIMAFGGDGKNQWAPSPATNRP